MSSRLVNSGLLARAGAIVAPILLTLGACGGGDEGGTEPIQYGWLRTIVSTAGDAPDFDGYQLLVGSHARADVALEDTVVLQIAARSHTVGLSGLQANCTVAPGTSTVTVPADDTVDVTFSVSCTGHVVAYARNDAGHSTIWRAVSDGSVQEPLASGGVQGSRPAWSPDGRFVAYAVGLTADSYAVDIRAPRSPDTKRVASRPLPILGVAWSPAGDRLVVSAFVGDVDNSVALYLVDTANGSVATPLTAERSGVQDMDPVWSPAGDRVVFTSAHHLYSIGADGTGRVRLTTSDSAEYDPAFSHDGQKLVMVMSPAPGEPGRLFIANADGTSRVEVAITNLGAGMRNPAWSPDGSHISFEYVSTGQHTWIVPATGGVAVRFPAPAALHTLDFAWQ